MEKNKNKKITKLKNLRKVNKKIISFQNLRRIKIKNSPFGKVLKIVFDGSHYVGTEIEERGPRKKKLTSDLYNFEKQKAMQEKQLYFDELFFLCLNQVKVYKMSDCNRNKELKELLKDGMLERYPDMENIEGYINVQVYRKVKNYYLKEKRLKSKGYLNKWNYFVTFTYDDKKHDEASFRQALKKSLSNFAYRRGWKYMGVFEESPEKKRLHFHAIMYIPDGEMVGELRTRKDYSTKQKKIQETVYNTFFEKKFGRCDFEAITNNNRQELIKAIKYMTKYIFKTNEQINYSRGLKTIIEKNIFCYKFFKFSSYIFILNKCSYLCFRGGLQ